MCKPLQFALASKARYRDPLMRRAYDLGPNLAPHSCVGRWAPCLRRAGPQGNKTIIMAQSATPPRVLLVEDDATDAEAVTRLLRSVRPPDEATQTYEVVHHHNLNSALQSVASDDVSAVLLDLRLPDSQGLETVDRMLKAAPAVPVLVLTGAADHGLGVDAVRQGAQDYLQKDNLAAHALSRAIDYAIERKRATDAQRRLDERLLTAQKLESLGVMAGSIAHDFNNLLSSVLGYAGLALDQVSPDAPYRDDILQIERAAQRAADLTRQLLAYSGKGRFIIEATDLSQLVKEMSTLVDLSAHKQVTVQYDLNPDLPPVHADTTQLRQVILNLISNAADASHVGGVVSLSTGTTQVDAGYQAKLGDEYDLPPGNYLYFEVSDSGSGMSSQTRLRMFDPFFTTKRSGHGLGLAAVQGIVQGHRGAIKVESKEGKGTTIKVLLPASEGQVCKPEQPNDPIQWQAHGTILIVDDEPGVREVAQAMFKRYGLKVMLADGGNHGVEMFRKHHDEIDAVLLDMTMPDLDGAAVYQEMRKIQPSVKVVLTSGYNEQEPINRIAGKGIAGFVAKPFKMRELATAFRSLLDQE